MACVARLIGLPEEAGQEDDCRSLGCVVVDSEADTEVEDEDGSPSSPSFIPETPLRIVSGQQGEENVSALQGEEMEDCSAGVCEEACDGLSDRSREEAQSESDVSAMETAADGDGTDAAVMCREGMEVECVSGGAEEEVVGVRR